MNYIRRNKFFATLFVAFACYALLSSEGTDIGALFAMAYAGAAGFFVGRNSGRSYGIKDTLFYVGKEWDLDTFKKHRDDVHKYLEGTDAEK